MKTYLTTVGVAALIAAMPAYAQSAPADSTAQAAPAAENGENGIADIVVTASRREQTLQKTAIAVTALSSGDLAAKGVVNVIEITKLAPAVKIGQTAGAGVQITVRGVGNFGGNSFAEPGVAVNLDGVYLARPPGPSGIFYDVDRVEILKGPQGTLYGRNATGGVVNVITKNPTDQLGGEITAEIGNYNLFRGSAAINLPVAEGVAIRIAGQAIDRDGYYSDGTGDEKGYAGRIKIKLDPSDALTIMLEADYQKVKGKGQNGVFVPYLDPNNPYLGSATPQSNALLPPFLYRVTDQGFLNYDGYGFQGSADYRMGFATASLIVANRTLKQQYLHFAPGFPITDNNRDDPSNTTTAELRLTSNGDSGFKWVVGGYYLNDYLHTRISPDQGGATFASPDVVVRTKSLSAFGEATLSVSDTFRVTAGGRYTSDDKAISGTQLVPLAGPCPAPAVVVPGPVFGSYAQYTTTPFPFANGCRAPVSGQATFNKFTWKAGVEFDIAERSLLYASVATGYKAGGFYASLNTAPAGSFPNNAYRPEELTAYTVGSKNRFLDNTLQLNLEAFYWDYKDKQVPHIGLIQPSGISLIAENAASAEVYGAELEALWEPTRNDTFNLGVQYLHAKYGQFTYSAVVPGFAQNPAATPFVGCPFTPVVGLGGAPGGAGVPGVSTVNCSNREVPFSPEWVVNIGYKHTFNLANESRIVAGISTHIEAAFQIGEEYLPGQRQDASTVSDADLTWKSANDRYFVTAYVQNIEDKAVQQTGFVQPIIGRPLATLRQPRTFGVRFGVKF